MSLAAAALILGLPSTALANQPPPGVGGMPGGGPAGPGAPSGPSDDKDGPAEAAPKDKGALAPVVPVPAQPEGRRRTQLFELHGYFRMRTDYFHRLDLNLVQEGVDESTNKFFLPPAENAEPNLDEQDTLQANDANCVQQLLAAGVSTTRIGNRCPRRRGMGGANLRLRLEPTIHVTDTVKVHAQVDLLDNLVLGSTPDAYYGSNPWAPIDLLTRTQLPPVQGIDSINDTIVVKRAWGEVRFGFGLTLEFGRMPNHWGMGVVYNDGNGYDRGEAADITRMVDTDYGDSVDTARASFDFGADKRSAINVGLSYDWASSGPTTAQLFGPQWESGNLIAQTFSVEKYDNVHQVSAWVARRDDPSMLRRKLSTGAPVVNYGFKTWMRWQTLDNAIGFPSTSLGASSGDVTTSYSASLVHRRAWAVTPDLWLRINWRTLRVEIEGAMVAGSFRHAPQSDTPPADLDDALATATSTDFTRMLQFGYALEFKYGLFNDRFHIGLDHGVASGDSTPPRALNYADPYPVTADSLGDGGSLNAFRFNPAYAQDMLLFKELLGTVSNAGYVKPWAAFYFFQNNFSARVDIEFAGAMNRAGTLAGDKSLWGLELDGGIRYHDVNDPIFIQVQYGVMFPFGGFEPTVEFSNGTTTRLEAKAAQTVQAQIGIRF